ncbi:hypothetical protein [Phenylobacterium immobile]|uniref:hypothetical protein n=1 Tax=Phenylobacterium immobile TaxID=21 RepID=UPI000A82F93B|nr:hypothetical protein [Phenylobacterium immobile]
MPVLPGASAPSAFPAFPACPAGMFDMSAATRSPFGWTAPFWDFYAAAAQRNMEMWSAALSMRPATFQDVFADAQKAMLLPLTAYAAPRAQPIAIIAETIDEPMAAAQSVVASAVETATSAADLPSRIETDDEPEPAMVGGEAAPISPVIAKE